MNFECDDTDKQVLMRYVFEEEIKYVLFGMASDISPSLDGFTCEFYKACWPVIKKDFVVANQSVNRLGAQLIYHRFYHFYFMV